MSEQNWHSVPWLKDWLAIERLDGSLDGNRLETAHQFCDYLNALEERVRAAEETLRTCPVCYGRGHVQEGFYSTTTGAWASTATGSEMCRSCAGTGWVIASDLKAQLADSEAERQAAEGRAATLRAALESLTWTVHRAGHNWKLHGVIDCPEPECVESRAACGFSSPVPAARDGEAEA